MLSVCKLLGGSGVERMLAVIKSINKNKANKFKCLVYNNINVYVIVVWNGENILI